MNESLHKLSILTVKNIELQTQIKELKEDQFGKNLIKTTAYQSSIQLKNLELGKLIEKLNLLNQYVIRISTDDKSIAETIQGLEKQTYKRYERNSKEIKTFEIHWKKVFELNKKKLNLLLRSHELSVNIKRFKDMQAEINDLKKTNRYDFYGSPISNVSSMNSSPFSVSLFNSPVKQNQEAKNLMSKLLRLEERNKAIQINSFKLFSPEVLKDLQNRIELERTKIKSLQEFKFKNLNGELSQIESSFDESICSIRNKIENIRSESSNITRETSRIKTDKVEHA